ncbi:MAG: tetratricopeptide repeat protein, partial [Ruminococcus sp.]|nr:tetratricopeptide repeat protein [Ruminococcus sp.]
MDKNELIKELHAKLGDSAEENDRILKAEAEKYAHAGDLDSFNAVGELIMELMPEERKQEIERLTHLDGERLDMVYNRIVDMINKKQIIEAVPVAERLYKKIILEYAPTE